MSKKEHIAEWRGEMTKQESDQLSLARSAKDASSGTWKQLERQIKDRCIKRLRRKGDNA